MFRFRSFRNRLMLVLLVLTAGVQGVAFFIVRDLHWKAARREMQRQLDTARNQLSREVAVRTADLARSAAALSSSLEFGEALATTRDRATLQSGLESFQLRVGANMVALMSLDGALLAVSPDDSTDEPVFRILQRAADQSDAGQATGYGVIQHELYSIAVVPLRAPDVVAWIAVGFRLDRHFIAELKETSGVEVAIRHGNRELATTVPRPADYETRELNLPLAGGGIVDVVLQASRDEILAPARQLERKLGWVFAGSLLVAVLLAIWVARDVSEPVRQLAAHTQVVAKGDYGARINLQRVDEFGDLAAAFNDMSAGLAERDRIRDLLDKNVSPEVAARLLREGAALGGEERRVTVLFADLRGFTTLSEKLAPRDLLALLNRYLDRMSAEIEQRGGVIDKYIGDAIMALFGAPLDQPDSADRALAAALGMEAALAELNRELAAEGRAPLAVGIGVNTARVVAGNIGSHRRLNYSVIGDGVNIAARLQSLTRTPSFKTNVITSESTAAAVRDHAPFAMRSLGSVELKGRTEPVAVFAVSAA